MKKLICTNVSRPAWNSEKVTLESDDTEVVINIKDPAEHGQFAKGESYDISVGEKVKAKATTKKPAKKVAKKTAAKVVVATTEQPQV